MSSATLPVHFIGRAISSESGSSSPEDMSAASNSSSSTVCMKAIASRVSCPVIPSGMMMENFLPVLKSICLAPALPDESGTRDTQKGHTLFFFSSMAPS